MPNIPQNDHSIEAKKLTPPIIGTTNQILQFGSFEERPKVAKVLTI
jgi:hypothetical protein